MRPAWRRTSKLAPSATGTATALNAAGDDLFVVAFSLEQSRPPRRLERASEQRGFLQDDGAIADVLRGAAIGDLDKADGSRSAFIGAGQSLKSCISTSFVFNFAGAKTAEKPSSSSERGER